MKNCFGEKLMIINSPALLFRWVTGDMEMVYAQAKFPLFFHDWARYFLAHLLHLETLTSCLPLFLRTPYFFPLCLQWLFPLSHPHWKHTLVPGCPVLKQLSVDPTLHFNHESVFIFYFTNFKSFLFNHCLHILYFFLYASVSSS